MSRSEMISEFLSGNLSRRDFVRGLVGTGVAVGAAAAHAAALDPGLRAAAQDGLDDYYNLTSKEQCKNGGYKDFGFKNQGQCIRFVNTGKAPAVSATTEESGTGETAEVSEPRGTEEEPGDTEAPRSARPRP